jgi:short-subunit dehydrogenase
VALELASRNTVLALTGRRSAALAETAELAAERGGTAYPISADLGAEGEPERAVAEAVATLGGLDAVISNAGNVRGGPLEDTSVAEIDAMIRVNLRAPIVLARAALPHLRKAGAEHGHAALVGVASLAAQVGLPYYATYGATKAGVALFDEALRRELHGSGVHVATVFPGPVDTDMMATARPVPGLERLPLEKVVADIVAGLEARHTGIDAHLPESRAMRELNARDPLAVDAQLAPGLAELRAAVREHRSM